MAAVVRAHVFASEGTGPFTVPVTVANMFVVDRQQNPTWGVDKWKKKQTLVHVLHC